MTFTLVTLCSKIHTNIYCSENKAIAWIEKYTYLLKMENTGKKSQQKFYHLEVITTDILVNSIPDFMFCKLICILRNKIILLNNLLFLMNYDVPFVFNKL